MSLIVDVDILDESKECFLTYAEEVLTDRSIPNAEDGLLSVHRKILWTCEEVLNLNSKSKYKKSASIVGSTLSTSYFHGDSACYGALCKLAQGYLMRYPLIDGEGNLGNQEGNGKGQACNSIQWRLCVTESNGSIEYCTYSRQWCAHLNLKRKRAGKHGLCEKRPVDRS